MFAGRGKVYRSPPELADRVRAVPSPAERCWNANVNGSYDPPGHLRDYRAVFVVAYGSHRLSSYAPTASTSFANHPASDRTAPKNGRPLQKLPGSNLQRYRSGR